jgi:hypothetical protein
LDPKLIVGLGSLEDKLLLRKKRKIHSKNAMQDRLPDEILKFRKVGLVLRGYITKVRFKTIRFFLEK